MLPLVCNIHLMQVASSLSDNMVYFTSLECMVKEGRVPTAGEGLIGEGGVVDMAAASAEAAGYVERWGLGRLRLQHQRNTNKSHSVLSPRATCLSL